jgi:prepilin-type N-terminal cleavage/methylation domain-containing protein
MKNICLKNKAFTIIELLITISIMGLLLTVGLVYYQDFNRRQVVVQAANNLKNNLRLAQSKALSGEKIEGCSGTFGGYKVEFFPDENEYVVSAICDHILVEYKRYSLEGTELAEYPSYLIFKPLAGGVEIAQGGGTPPGGSAGITLSRINHSSEVTVSESGEIAVEADVPYVPPPTVVPTPTPEPGSPPSEPTPTDTPIPTPTPLCIAEGENKPIYFGGPDCCPGLTAISNYQIDETGCHLLLGGEVCAYCPNGECGPGENECNCSEDCGGPTCTSSTGTSCGTGSCACYERHDWQISDPSGCTGEEDFDTCTWDFNCLLQCY